MSSSEASSTAGALHLSADQPPGERQGMTRGLTLLFAVAGGVAVGNLYWAQPLLGFIGGGLPAAGGGPRRAVPGAPGWVPGGGPPCCAPRGGPKTGRAPPRGVGLSRAPPPPPAA